MKMSDDDSKNKEPYNLAYSVSHDTINHILPSAAQLEKYDFMPDPITTAPALPIDDIMYAVDWRG